MGPVNLKNRKLLLYIIVAAHLIPLTFLVEKTQALTASVGQPYHGKLVNGVPFPAQFPGYRLREEGRTYTTPEVVGALLDAIDSVREKYPETCDLYLGDFSTVTGGSASHHRSHQNGRDVDIGMYAKGNRPLDQLVSMNEDNLDVPKTWHLMENIIRSQRVQYIFLDRRIQKLLYDYALSHGSDPVYLDRLFGAAKGALVMHVPNHDNHMHVRFFTPWSTLAAHVSSEEPQKRMVIEMAQQAYLPKRVNYYVNGSEPNLDNLAQSFGVTRRELCRWNQISGGTVLSPGSCLVFYKRNFEAEPVRLAQSLQPGFISEAPPIQMASLRPSTESLTDAADTGSQPVRQIKIKEKEPVVPQKKVEAAPAPPPIRTLYMVRRGDNVDRISKRTGIDVKTLCALNGIKKNTPVKPGQTLRLASVQMLPTTVDMPSSHSRASSKSAQPAASSVAVAKGDTLEKVSRKTGVDMATLMQLNGLKKNAALKPGQTLRLPQAAPSKGTAGVKSAPVQTVSGKASGKTSVQTTAAAKAQPSAKAAPQTAAKTQTAIKGKPAAKGAPQPAAKTQPAKNQPAAKVAAASKNTPAAKNAPAAAKAPGKSTAASNAKAVAAPQKAPAGGKAAVQPAAGNKNAKSAAPVGKVSSNANSTKGKRVN